MSRGSDVSCGKQMRQLLSRVEALEIEAEPLRSDQLILLKAGLTELKFCCTCSRSAVEYCDLARKDLKEAQNEIERAREQ